MPVFVSGPIFDGRARNAAADFCDEAREEIAQQGKAMVLAELGTVLRHPTGYYESQQTVVPDGGDRTKIWDDYVIYGPWLEGVGSRNKTTRFKGYFTYRRTRGVLDRAAGGIAEDVLHRFIGRMR